jgi:Leucine-rich repeat (LRR) protein
LEELYLTHNQITDLTGLSGLTGLKELTLGGNKITEDSEH